MATTTLRQKALFEMREYVVLTAYLWLCFGALVLFKDSILRAEGLSYLPLGTAAIKAAVSAKFIMLGRVLHLTDSRLGERLLMGILRKAVILLILLVVLTVIEEVAIAAIHGRPLSDAMTHLGGSVGEFAASILIVLLILIPYVGLQALDEALGKGELLRLMLERSRDAGRSKRGGAP